MKTITKEYDVYEYAELSKEAKQKALNDCNEYNDIYFLGSMLNDECGQLIKDYGIICTSNHPVCLYSLSNCQGDGLMFKGSFLWKEYSIKIKHQGHYYHSFSKSIEITRISEGQEIEASKEDEDAFEAIYQTVCKNLEKYGYDLIEDETSEAHFIDNCNANEWTFTKDGVMLNDNA